MGFPIPCKYEWNDNASTTVVYNNEAELTGLPNPRLIDSGETEVVVVLQGDITCTDDGNGNITITEVVDNG